MIFVLLLLENIIFVLHCHVQVLLSCSFTLVDVHFIPDHVMESFDREFNMTNFLTIYYVDRHLLVQEMFLQLVFVRQVYHWRKLGHCLELVTTFAEDIFDITCLDTVTITVDSNGTVLVIFFAVERNIKGHLMGSLQQK